MICLFVFYFTSSRDRSIYTCVCVCVCVCFVCLCACIYICMYVCVCVCVYIYILHSDNARAPHTHTHTHTHTTLYSLLWYKSTHTDAEGAATVYECGAEPVPFTSQTRERVYRMKRICGPLLKYCKTSRRKDWQEDTRHAQIAKILLS
jgi:hypothetical protein